MAIRSLHIAGAFVTAAAFAVGCSGAQPSSSVAPALREPTSSPSLVGFDALPSEKCQNSPDLRVVPCHLTFTRDRAKGIAVEGTSYARLLDNCERLATISDVSGPAWLVTPKKAKGTCAAVFVHNGQFAILTIDDQL